VGSAELIRFNLVATEKVAPNDFAVLNEKGASIPAIVDGDRWVRGDHELLPRGAGDECDLHPWSIKSTRPMTAFYWYMTENAVPRLDTLAVAPERVVMNQGGRITLSTALSDTTIPTFPACYNVVFSGPGFEQTARLNAHEPTAEVSKTVRLPASLDWQDTAVTAKLVYAGETPQPVSAQVVTAALAVRWEPEVDAARATVVVDELTNNVTFTVPIAHAAKIPGFVPTFQPERGPNALVTTNDCTKNPEQHARGSDSSPDANGTITYTRSYAYNTVFEPGCAYSQLRVSLPGVTTLPAWAIIPATTLAVATSALTATPAPTPTATGGESPPQPPPGTFLPWWGWTFLGVALLVAAAVMVAIVARKNPGAMARFTNRTKGTA
jgi:hypothetical protein